MTKADQKLYRVTKEHAEMVYNISLEKYHQDRKKMLKKQYAKWQTQKED